MHRSVGKRNSIRFHQRLRRNGCLLRPKGKNRGVIDYPMIPYDPSVRPCYFSNVLPLSKTIGAPLPRIVIQDSWTVQLCSNDHLWITQAVAQAARCWDNDQTPLKMEVSFATKARSSSIFPCVQKNTGFERSLLTPTTETHRLRQQVSQSMWTTNYNRLYLTITTVRIEPWSEQLLVSPHLDSVAWPWTERGSVANIFDPYPQLRWTKPFLNLLSSDLVYLITCSLNLEVFSLAPKVAKLPACQWQLTQMATSDGNGELSCSKLGKLDITTCTFKEDFWDVTPLLPGVISNRKWQRKKRPLVRLPNMRTSWNLMPGRFLEICHFYSLPYNMNKKLFEICYLVLQLQQHALLYQQHQLLPKQTTTFDLRFWTGLVRNDLKCATQHLF